MASSDFGIYLRLGFDSLAKCLKIFKSDSSEFHFNEKYLISSIQNHSLYYRVCSHKVGQNLTVRRKYKSQVQYKMENYNFLTLESLKIY